MCRTAAFVRRAFVALVLAVAAAPQAAAQLLVASDPAGDRLTFVDPLAGAVVGEAATGAGPVAVALAPGGGRLFVAEAAAGRLGVLDVGTGGAGPVTIGGGPSAVAIDPAGARVFVTDAAGGSMTVVNAATAAVLGTVAVGPSPVAVAADGTRAYSADFAGDTLTIVDAASATVEATVPVGGFPSGVAADPAGGRVWVANFFDDTVSVVDPAAAAVIATVPVAADPRGIVFDPVLGRVYVAGVTSHAVTVLDAATHAVVDTVPSGGLNPADLVVSPGGDRLYVLHLASGGIAVIDTATLAVVETIDLPAGHVALAGFAAGVPEPGGVVEIPTLGVAGFALLAALLALAGFAVLRRRRGAAAGLALVLAAAPAALAAEPLGPAFQITDGTFADADWEVFDATTGDGSHTVMQSVSGGNPGAYRRMGHFGQSIEVVHRYIGAGNIYDPAALGPIASIDVAWDRAVVGADGAVPEFEESVAVVQGGVAYFTAPELFQPATIGVWEPFSATGLTAADFDDGAANQPDFSASGAPLTFGYRRSNTSPGANDALLHGIDNVSIAVESEGGGGPGQAGVLRFEFPSSITIDGEAATLVVQRTGATDGAVGATVSIPLADFSVVTEVVSWADGDGADKVVVTPATGFLPPGGGIGASEVTLGTPTGGVQIHPERGKTLVLVAPAEAPELVLLALLMRLLLAAAGPVTAAVLAAAALGALWRRRRQRARGAEPEPAPGRRRTNGTALVAVAGLALIAPGCGTIPVTFYLTEPAETNPRLRLDGEPPDAAQAAMDPFRGPFRNGDPETEVVSELFPDLGGREEKLPYSNCFWISNPANGVGDFVKLSWETVATVHRASAHLHCSSPTRLGFCKLRDPVDGRWLVHHDLDEDPPECPGDPPLPPGAQVPSGTDALARDGFLDEIPDGPFSLGDYWPFETRLPAFYGLELREVVAPADPHRRCPGSVDDFAAFAGSGRAPQLYGPNRCHPPPDLGEDYYPICGQLCVVRPGGAPAGDVTYRLVREVVDLDHHLRPNVMSVDGSATLTRAMELVNGSYLWRTGASISEGGSRWHENFSHRIRVERVRVFVDAGGLEKPLPLAPASTLQVSGSTSQGPVEAWSCAGEVAPDGVVFTLYPEGTCNDDDLLATPTFVHRHLTDTVDSLSQPLTWSVTPRGAVAGDVYIEFTVVGAVKDSMALSITSPHDFGRVPLGETARRWVVVENVGGEVAVIDDVYLDGSEAAEFSFVLPSEPKPMTLPVTGELGPGEVTMSVATSFDDALPLIAGDTDVTGTAVRLTAVAYEGTIQTYNGHQVEFRSGLAFYDDPDADFVIEPVAEDGFAVAMTAYLDRATPFELLPGASFEAVVTAEPAGYDQRWGELHVAAYQLTDPGVRQDFYASLIVDGVDGPYVEVVPATLWFPLGSEGDRAWWRELAVLNPSLFPVERSFEIVGPAASLFEVMSPNEPVATLEPGDAEVFRVRYALPCPGPIPPVQIDAELRIDTGSDVEIVELYGFVPSECTVP